MIYFNLASDDLISLTVNEDYIAPVEYMIGWLEDLVGIDLYSIVYRCMDTSHELMERLYDAMASYKAWDTDSGD